LSDRYNKKWIIYSVDAIPAPIGWVNDGGFYRNLKIYISKYIERCDAFFSSNEQMLRYQLEGVKNPPLYNGVIYTPIRDIAITSCEKTTSSPVFLYTGGIYGPRKKEALLDGFRMLLNDYPNAQLLFVGIGNNHNFETYNDLISTGNIRICDYVQDLSMYYNQATALIDINAYFDNDVFLSSKVVNYLTIPKPIISITGYNSPSRNIFRESKSIIHSSHNPHTIYQALLKSINMNLDILKDRQIYINKFSAESIVREFMSVLYKI
jgi:hypothetical protein